MHLKDLVLNHKAGFTEKVERLFAKKYEISIEQVREEHKAAIEQYIQGKYKGIDRVVSKILEFKLPVVLSIRRDPCSEYVCMICERDKPNIEELRQLYSDRIGFIDVFDSTPEGALYHIIQQHGECENLLPLIAIIYNGEVIKYWSCRPVGVEEYRKYLDPLLQS
ncbi:MAG: hypothetical protein H0M93_04345 [Methanophagales archaeon]|nr:hypothetical protein [Methanophagales archaeon]